MRLPRRDLIALLVLPFVAAALTHGPGGTTRGVILRALLPVSVLYLSLRLCSGVCLPARAGRRDPAGAIRSALPHEKPPRDGIGDRLIDPLTRLPNARFLFVSFQEEVDRATRYRGPLSLIELDVDGFGEINNRYGYPAGDRILRGVARAIRSQLRSCDSCVRYASDEFIITVPGVGKDGIEAVKARVAAAIANHKFVVAGGQPLIVTASLGWATFPEDGRSFEALIAVADARMYGKRFAGREGPREAGGYQRFSGRRDVPVN